MKIKFSTFLLTHLALAPLVLATSGGRDQRKTTDALNVENQRTSSSDEYELINELKRRKIYTESRINSDTSCGESCGKSSWRS